MTVKRKTSLLYVGLVLHMSVRLMLLLSRKRNWQPAFPNVAMVFRHYEYELAYTISLAGTGTGTRLIHHQLVHQLVETSLAGALIG